MQEEMEEYIPKKANTSKPPISIEEAPKEREEERPAPTGPRPFLPFLYNTKAIENILKGFGKDEMSLPEVLLTTYLLQQQSLLQMMQMNLLEKRMGGNEVEKRIERLEKMIEDLARGKGREIPEELKPVVEYFKRQEERERVRRVIEESVLPKIEALEAKISSMSGGEADRLRAELSALRKAIEEKLSKGELDAFLENIGKVDALMRKIDDLRRRLGGAPAPTSLPVRPPSQPTEGAKTILDLIERVVGLLGTIQAMRGQQPQQPPEKKEVRKLGEKPKVRVVAEERPAEERPTERPERPSRLEREKKGLGEIRKEVEEAKGIREEVEGLGRPSGEVPEGGPEGEAGGEPAGGRPEGVGEEPVQATEPLGEEHEAVPSADAEGELVEGGGVPAGRGEVGKGAGEEGAVPEGGAEEPESEGVAERGGGGGVRNPLQVHVGEYMSLAEAAAELGYKSVTSLKKKIKKGQVRAVKIPRGKKGYVWRIPREEVERLKKLRG